LAVSVARVIWRDSLAKIADTKIIGIGIEWFIWYNLSSVLGLLVHVFNNKNKMASVISVLVI
jgi:hypothetical protein